MLAFSDSQTSDSDPPLVRPQRLLKLVALLEGGGTVTGDSLAQSLGVCRRTVFRDIKLLRAANIPISFDMSHQTYRIHRNEVIQAGRGGVVPIPDAGWIHDGTVCRCPKIMAEEIAALLLALRLAGPLPESVMNACESALVKIMAAALPTARQQAVDIMEESDQAAKHLEPQVLPLRPRVSGSQSSRQTTVPGMSRRDKQNRLHPLAASDAS